MLNNHLPGTSPHDLRIHLYGVLGLIAELESVRKSAGILAHSTACQPLTKMSIEVDASYQRELTNVDRGFIAPLVPGVVKDSAGKVVWDIDSYGFLNTSGECPPTINRKLWRHSQLTSKQGLFEVVPGIYQVRSLDISNLTFVEGEHGLIAIDPLVSNEVATAALELYRKHRDPTGRRKLSGLVYTHPHADHFGGAAGVIGDNEAARKAVPIIAPEGYMEALMNESLIAGPSMHHRAVYMFGMALPKGPKAHVGNGLGIGSSMGSRSLIPPNTLIKETGDELIVDGVRMVFHMAPETEAPAEINIHFPDFKTLLIAETATITMHNITTLRGAQVRDAKAWARSLDEAIVLYGGDSDVLIGSHHWPTWGQAELVNRLAEQRDMYLYMHDQTVRLMNQGLTGVEIAEQLKLPPRLEKAWHCQGFYGSLSHNVKGIYQRYMTWFDGNPATLWRHPPAAEGRRYVDCLGGIDALCDKADAYRAGGDLRFAATLLDHAVAADPAHARPRALLAATYEQLGYGAENGPWRNFYLTGAQGLRTGTRPGEDQLGRSPLAKTLTVEQWLDILSVQVDGEKAAEVRFVIDIDVTDDEQSWRVTVSNGALNYRQKVQLPVVGETANLSMAVSRVGLREVLLGGDIRNVPGAKYHGSLKVLDMLLDIVSTRPPEQNISSSSSLVIDITLEKS